MTTPARNGPARIYKFTIPADGGYDVTLDWP